MTRWQRLRAQGPFRTWNSPLFLPRIGVVVVAVALPEAELVVVEELEATDPLAALPEIPLRDQQPERVAVFGLERRPAERVGQQDVVVIEDRERDVGGVALLGMRDDVCRVRADAGHLEDRLDGDALPVGVELRPAGHAMDVGVDGLARQGLELVPGQGERRIHLAPDLEIPFRQVDVRDRAVVEDGELVGLVLTGRDPLRDGWVRLAGAEESIEHRGPYPRAERMRIVSYAGDGPVTGETGGCGTLRPCPSRNPRQSPRRAS